MYFIKTMIFIDLFRFADTDRVKIIKLKFKNFLYKKNEFFFNIDQYWTANSYLRYDF